MQNFQTLNNDHLKRFAPSVFTETAGEKTSSKYQHISTIQIVDGLASEGFLPVMAMQSRARSADKRAHTKHMLRFRHHSATANSAGLYPELVLINSHDGLSSYRLMAGLFRLVCTNGIIAGERFAEVRVKHQGNILDNVIEGTYTVMDSANKMLEHADNMSAIILSEPEKIIFAESVHSLRFEGKSVDESGINPRKFLEVRRGSEQGKNDLFTVFNVAQENAIKGGLTGYALHEKGKYTRKNDGARVARISTREVLSIDKNTSLNRALWQLAEKMAELKA